MKKFGLLFIVAILVLTSCGSKSKDDAVIDITYHADFFDSGLPYEFFDGCAGNNEENTLYLTARQIHESDYSTYLIYKMSSGGVPSCLLSSEDFLDGTEGAVSINAIQPGADGSLWLTVFIVKNGTDSAFQNILWHVDQNGMKLERIDLEQLQENWGIEQINQVFIDNDSWIYLISEHSLYALDRRQQLQFTLDIKNNLQLVRLGDGQAGFLSAGNSGTEVKTIDKEAQDWGESYQLPADCRKAIPGSGGYQFFCDSDGKLLGWDIEEQMFIPLFNWLETGVSASSLLCFSIQEDGQILAALNEHNATRFALISPSDGSEDREKTVLTFAAPVGNSVLRQYIAEFNRASDSCCIIYKTYYTQSGDYSPMSFSRGCCGS